MIKLYSTHCPFCNVVESKLKEKNISFDIIDDLNEVLAKAKIYNTDTVPFAEIDGQYIPGRELFMKLTQGDL